MNDANVPMDATAEQASALVRAALAWRWKIMDEALMTREEWQLVDACEAYGDTYKGVKGR